MTQTKMPSGLSEAEEAQWHFDHRDELADRFLSSPAALNPERGVAARRFGLRPHLTYAPEDIALARRQAEAVGVSLDDYAAQLFHEALQARELRKAG